MRVRATGGHMGLHHRVARGREASRGEYLRQVRAHRSSRRAAQREYHATARVGPHAADRPALHVGEPGQRLVQIEIFHDYIIYNINLNL